MTDSRLVPRCREDITLQDAVDILTGADVDNDDPSAFGEVDII